MNIQTLRERALELGFDHLSVTRPLISSRDESEYRAWAVSGAAAGMGYMVREPQKRARPVEAYPGVKSVLTLAVSYFRGNFPSKPSEPAGRVARYAWGRDYHTVIADRLSGFIATLNELAPAANPRVAVDTKPLLERALAASSKLGFIGKNTVLIIPRRAAGKAGFHVGSYVFLAEVLLDVEIEPGENPQELSGCGSCRSCLDSCPTEAFQGPHKLDAGRCIAYLTIENKGAIPLELRSKIGDWIFGCDVCQEVCPFNARVAESRWPEFHPAEGVGPWVPLREILRCPDDASFKAKWGNTPLSRPKRAGLIRNACVASGNSGDKSLIPFLEPLRFDANEIIREHAAWALERL